ncbi:MAG: alpha-L-fucosidase [Bacteroidota bacterium]
MKRTVITKRFCLFTIFVCSAILISAQSTWTNPIIKQGRLGSPLVETSPFVFKNRLYLMENNQRFWDVSGAKPGDFFHEDEVRIRDVESKKIASVALRNHGFGTVLTWEGRVYVFAGNYGQNKPWRQMTEISMTSSADLKHWTKPVTVFRAAPNEFFFNTAVCRGKDKFILLYETNDKRWPAFTFRYMESSDLKNWKEIPDAIYGKDKYVGGPALYYEGDWYYTLYLESLKKGYETRITRSKDLVHWEDAPAGRSFITFDPSHKNILLIKPDIRESNASDVELCYYKGKTILYFTGSDQTTAGDLQWATYDGTPRQLCEHFFNDPEKQSAVPPSHKGDWTPVLVAPSGEVQKQISASSEINYKPSSQQLAYQQDQIGAFIHFGPATFNKSDFLAVPVADLFNPSKLDAEQWVKTAKSFGAKHLVLTAKHHNGYCLWPTKTTDYSVMQSPWKNGKGDVVDEFVKACKKHDMKIGFYVSAGDKHFGCTSTPDPQGERKLAGDIDKYFPVFLEQLRELLTGYGKISYLWFDGAYDPFGWDVMDPKTMKPLGTAYGDAIRSMVKHLQPDAIVMGGTKPDIRWSGSEQGWAAYPLWNVVKPGEGLTHWVGPQSAGWLPAEACINTRDVWFWAPNSDKTLRNIDFMTKVYFESIGRGANLLINMTPDTSGIIPQVEVKNLDELGKKINRMFSTPLGILNLKQTGDTINLQVSEKGKIELIEVEEEISSGQHIQQYKVEASIAGQWKLVSSGLSIGRKRVEIIEPVQTNQVRLILTGNKDKMRVKKFAVYAKPN